MKYINGYELGTLLRSDEPKIFFYVIQDPTEHSSGNALSCAYIRTETEEFYTSFNHPDHPESNVVMDPVLNNCITHDIKTLMHLGWTATDCHDCMFDLTTPIIPHRTVQQFEYRYGDAIKDLNLVIPISTHLAALKASVDYHYDYLRSQFNRELRSDYNHFYNKQYPSVFCKIERQRLKVDEELFVKTFGEDKRKLIHDGFVNTHYNLHTNTGRPSNAFGGVNYAALNKQDDSRSCFISQYDDGILVNVDFNSFHVHLIAMYLLEYKLPDDVHTEWGKIYFDKQQLTQEEYEESKRITFQGLYGYSLNESTEKIDFFHKVIEYRHKLWDEYQINGLTSFAGRKITVPDPNASKVFNYLIQALETEMSVMFPLKNLIELNHIPILYTYDSMLFDIHADELDDFIKSVSSQRYDLTSTLPYPFTVETGKTLKDMTKVQL